MTHDRFNVWCPYPVHIVKDFPVRATTVTNPNLCNAMRDVMQQGSSFCLPTIYFWSLCSWKSATNVIIRVKAQISKADIQSRQPLPPPIVVVVVVVVALQDVGNHSFPQISYPLQLYINLVCFAPFHNPCSDNHFHNLISYVIPLFSAVPLALQNRGEKRVASTFL